MRTAGWILGAAALAALAGCAGKAPEQESHRYDCEIEGRPYVVTHPRACIREGGRIVETSSEPSDWTVQAVKVKWQGREEIKSGRFHYYRAGDRGEMRLELPEAGDSCRGAYRLYSFGDADWAAVCDSGQKIQGTVFLDQGGVSASGHGKDGEGRVFGFYAPQPES